MKIAVVGATGLVGRNIINLCEEYFESDVQYSLYASSKSAGSELTINNRNIVVQELNEKNILNFDLVLFSAGGERAQLYAKSFVDKGAFVIDNSSAFRMLDDVPLVVYGVNEEAITKSTKLISNPNCTTMGLVMSLKPLHDAYVLKSITPTSYQAVSGSGTRAVESLEKELTLSDNLLSDYSEGFYGQPVAKNVIPVAGNLLENGYSDEEMKFVNESRKILSIKNLIVEPSNARVGVKTGHGTFCSAVFENQVDVESAINLLSQFDGVEYWSDKLPTPLDAQGQNNVLVSRLREGLSSNKILNFWVVSDNLLKGAALNAVQIAKHVSTL